MSEAILVLGAAGFIGRHLAERFAADGHAVVAATRRPVAFDHPAITSVVSPFETPAQFASALGGCNWVVHAASTSTPGSSAADPLLELQALRTTLALLRALQDAPARPALLYLSSGGTLYGDRALPAQEDAPLLPLSYHGAGKVAAEHFIHAWTHQYGARAIALRPSNVYGPGQLPRPGFGVVATALQHARDRAPITIWGDGSAVRDYLHVDDLAALCRAVLASTQARGMAVYNASSGEGTTLCALLDAIDAVTGQPLRRIHAPARAMDIHHIVPGNAAARADFGWQPRVALDEGLRQTWRWFTTPR